MTGCESAGGCAGCFDAFQEASLGLFRAWIDWGADHFARFVLKQEP